MRKLRNISEDFIPFSRPSIGNEEITEVVEVLRSGWITTGLKTKKFEKAFASYVGSSHAVSVNSCTAALHLALDAVGVREGDEVVTTPMTFAATAEVIHYCRAKLRFVDISPLTMNIDVNALEEYLESRGKGRVKAVMPVHFAGLPCDMDKIMKLSEEYGFYVIEDSAHCFPGRHKEKNIGTIGHITCFSFYATKNITTGEGGMATTENGEWASRMEVMRLHGISRDAWKRYSSEGSWYYEIIAPGFKYNLTDIAAAIGIVQLKKANEFWERRKHIASLYRDLLGDLDEIEIPNSPENVDEMERSGKDHSWHLYVIKIKKNKLKIGRNEFLEELKEKGVGTSVHFIPLHLHPYYSRLGYKPEDFPVATDIFGRIFSIPIYPALTYEEVERIASALRSIILKYKK